ncbi:hypothetical protein PHYPO_G00077960 [Pangasianodon hypophthalmus]|uniref:Chemokine interleukin-8-like domain-containing protein n=1 Tax=Pangasianodon hypophthalmus TaxID=310915 RepID=A0A5N5LL98_PANHP|nr:hypothetical protein PHYPO_G00077960 [Pangasianodon hypophthalmus]
MKMDFKILLLILCITFVSVQGATPRCCIKTSPVHKQLLSRVIKFSVQDRSGGCETKALVLYFEQKILCAPLRQLPQLAKVRSVITGQEHF